MTTLGSAFRGNNGLSHVEFARSKHASHSDVARNGNFDEGDGVSVLVNVEAGASMANSSGNFDQRQDERVGDVIDTVCTT